MTSALRLEAAKFSTRTVDGLNRPLEGVEVEIECAAPNKATSLKFTSDRDGVVRGTYDAARCNPIVANVNKPGYGAYSTGIRPVYVIPRQFRAHELLRVAKLDGDERLREFRELLAGEFMAERGQFHDSVFRDEALWRPALRAVAREPEVTLRARELLALIGVPEDLQLIVQLPPPPPPPGFEERWRYAVVTALVNPSSEAEWEFLRRCALHEFGDRWVDAGAIQSLQLSGSQRSRQILEEARRKNTVQVTRIARALKYIDSRPAALVGATLESVTGRLPEILKLGTAMGSGAPRFNRAGDKALVDLRFHSGMDRLTYTATLHKIGDVWALRGIRETMQAFAP